MKGRIYNVLIGVPSQSIWQAEFGMALASMASWSIQHRLVSRDAAEKFETFNMRGSVLPYLREHIVTHAREVEATHILFIDSDQTFPKDTIRRLLGHDQPVVAANIPTKTIPANPTARLKKEGNLGGEVLYSQGREGLQQVWRVGTGVMLVDMEVFDQIPRPYFPLRWCPELGQYHGEDWSFCEKVEEAGIPIFVDHTLSKHVGHVGTLTYTHDHVVTKKEYEDVRNALVSAA